MPVIRVDLKIGVGRSAGQTGMATLLLTPVFMHICILIPNLRYTMVYKYR